MSAPHYYSWPTENSPVLFKNVGIPLANVFLIALVKEVSLDLLRGHRR